MGLLFTLCINIALAITTGPTPVKDSDGKKLYPKNAVDGRLSTSYATTSNQDLWFQLRLKKKTKINTISIWPGDMSKGKDSFRKSARPKKIRILVDGKQIGEQRRIQDQFKRFDFAVEATGKEIKIVIDEKFNGIISSNLHIAEIAVNFNDRSKTKSYDKWLKGSVAKAKLKKHNEKVKKHYLKIKSEEFGDKDAFAFLCQAAGDGPVFQQRQVNTLVSDGYRVQALDSSTQARKALRLLEDPNAITCLQRSALRVGGKKFFKRWSDVEYYMALGDLIGGPNYNVGAWGGSGWSKGELQSFAEPLPIEMDPFGMLWVSDTGNNRIQIFDENGRSKKIFGGKDPQIVDKWFKKGRPWYVSGAPALGKSGHFINPVDIVMIPQKKDVFSFATLDANGRIQVFDEKGSPLQSWVAEYDFAAQPKNGGTAYLTYIKKKKALCAIIQDSGSCYKIKNAEQISKFDIQDGVPTAVETLPNGKMLFAYTDKVVLYSHDGFRHRIVMDKTVLGESFEMMDMTLDEKNKLWVLTDNGDLFKFKNPKKVDFQFRITKLPLRNPRIAVQDDMLYVSFRDKIHVFDILQAHIEAKEAEKK